MKTARLAIVLLLLPFSIFAQNIGRLSTNEGLPQSFVSGLVQDNNGFIWIGTRNGLVRFDGKNFEIYQHRFNDKFSLTSNIIIDLKKDSHNNLWIEHETGEIDVLNLNTNVIQHYLAGNPDNFPVRPARRGWLTSSDGTFWCIDHSGNLGSLKSSGTVKYPARLFKNDTLRGIFEDNKNRMWILSQKGISRLDRNTGRTQYYKIPFITKFSGYRHLAPDIVGLHERKNGELMWGDRQNLIFFNPVSGGFRKVGLPFKTDCGIKWIDYGPDGKEYFESGRIVYAYDDKSGIRVVSRLEVSRLQDVQSFLVDRSGLIWLGTNTAGIYQVDLTENFKTFRYNKNFTEDLFRQEFGISLHQKFGWDSSDEYFLSSAYNLRSVYDSGGTLWLALKQTVCYYDNQRKVFVSLPPVPTLPKPLSGPFIIKGITFLSPGHPLVICSGGQIMEFDSDDKSWKPFVGYSYLKEVLGYLLQPQDIFADTEALWITTADYGLLRMDLKTKKLRLISSGKVTGSLPTNHLLKIEPDRTKENILWIGSYHGLICFDKSSLKCRVFSVPEGLPDNTIYSVCPDKAGYLWLSTNKGLCRFHPVSHTCRIFNVSHGLPGNEYNRFHHLALPDGRLGFGGTEGWTIFNPLAIKDDNFDTPIALTGIRINNVALLNGDRRKMPMPVNTLAKLELSHNENTLAIAFAGLQFNQPQDITYRYRLEGYDTGWVMAGHDREAVYTKLPPGSYVFKVNAGNSTGKWSSDIKTLEIIIEPPWWSTWWAYFLYAACAFLAVGLFINFRIRRGILNKEIILKQKEAAQLREIDEMKNRFFSNVTHELRTPLTLILGPAEQLQKEKKDKEGNRLLSTIIKNAGQLLDLTNQLLDLAKLEAKAVKPQYSDADIVMVIQSVTDAFKEEATAKKIALRFKHNASNAFYHFPYELLERILYNLLSNALKFTGPGGEVCIELTEEEAGVEITVRDTGSGIPKEKLPYIFNRFYQGSNTAGTGIGLSLVKELVDIQEGAIFADSYSYTDNNAVVSGTVFTLFFPYRNVTVAIEPDSVEEAAVNENENPDNLVLPHLLVVEDNKELAEFIIGSLTAYYTVHHAESGEKGFQTAIEVMPDIIISDVLMQGMDGFTLCALLKEDIRTSHIPVILLTAKIDFESRLKGLSQGADDYITKPFHVDELLLRLNNHLEQQKRLRDFIQEKMGLLPPPAEAGTLLQNPFLNEVYNIIDQNLDDPAFGVEELVETVSMSRASLHRKIKSLSGMSSGEFIRAYRLKKASELLLRDYNISQAAYSTGFGSPAYFAKCFKEAYSITPTEFIKKNS